MFRGPESVRNGSEEKIMLLRSETGQVEKMNYASITDNKRDHIRELNMIRKGKEGFLLNSFGQCESSGEENLERRQQRGSR